MPNNANDMARNRQLLFPATAGGINRGDGDGCDRCGMAEALEQGETGSVNDSTCSRKSNTIVITHAVVAVTYSDYIQHQFFPASARAWPTERWSWLESLSRQVIVVLYKGCGVIEHSLCTGLHLSCMSALPPLMSLLGVRALPVVNTSTLKLKLTGRSRAVRIIMIDVGGDGSFNTSNMNKHLKIYNAEKWTDLLAKEEASAVDKSTMKTGIGIG